MTWLAIETAPRDGTEILVYYETEYTNGKGCSVVSFSRYEYWIVTAVGGHDCEQDFDDKDVKFWMPLPPEPDN